MKGEGLMGNFACLKVGNVCLLRPCAVRWAKRPMPREGRDALCSELAYIKKGGVLDVRTSEKGDEGAG